MKTIGVIIIAGLIGLGSSAALAAPPGNAKSRTVVAKHKKKLERSLRFRALEYGAPVFIRIFKENRRLELWMQKDDGDFKKYKSYRICANSGGLGPKRYLGDHQSPEGFYQIREQDLNPYSQYHLAVNIGYPNKYDQVHGRTGGSIMIHGKCGSRGCFAMTDRRMEEIYTLVHAAFAAGQGSMRVHIYPFKLREKNLKRHEDSPWHGFWHNLKQGYDFFERHRRPAHVIVRGLRYHIINPYFIVDRTIS